MEKKKLKWLNTCLRISKYIMEVQSLQKQVLFYAFAFLTNCLNVTASKVLQKKDSNAFKQFIAIKALLLFKEEMTP